jgi:hypothetical protein
LGKFFYFFFAPCLLIGEIWGAQVSFHGIKTEWMKHKKNKFMLLDKKTIGEAQKI